MQNKLHKSQGKSGIEPLSSSRGQAVAKYAFSM
jgi:hypothetical protein